MTQRLTYTKPHILSALHDELLAAGIIPTCVGDVDADPDGIEMDVPDATVVATVDAVVAAHDKAAAVAAWQAARDAETTDADDVRAAYAKLQTDITLLGTRGQAFRDDATAMPATLTAAQVRGRLISIETGLADMADALARTDRMLAAAVRELARRRGA